MPDWSNMALVSLAYLGGGLSPGYWLVRWRAGVDVRTTGSGGTGATNVSRVLGRRAYVLVLVLDLAKGALVGAAARLLGVAETWGFAAAVAVVVGHVWPIWLGFRGGKGVGPFVGCWLVLVPLALLPCLAWGLILLPWLRRVSIAGLFGLVLLPASAWWLTDSRPAVLAAVGTVSLLLVSHRRNLRNFFADRLSAAIASSSEASTHTL